MLILTIRTDKPEAELGLFDGQTKLTYEVWHAHRALAETLHGKIRDLLSSQSKSLGDIEGIVVFKGPGSFTGLRIGITVANALAESYRLPIVGAQNAWIEDGIARLQNGESDQLVLPEYGAPVHITKPRS